MFTPLPLSHLHAPPPAWLLPDLLPQGSLVFLDGPAAVGKSLLAAAWAGYIHHHDPASSNPVLWLHGHPRSHLIAGYLLAHLIEPQRQLLHLLCESSLDQLGNEADFHFLGWLQENLQSQSPRLVIIDSLQQVFPFLATLESYRQRYLFSELERLADVAKATILFLHESATLSSLPVIQRAAHRRLQLSWHPNLKASRLLTVVKCQLGHIGSQFQIDINTSGQASWLLLEDNARLPQLARLASTFSTPKPRGPASCIHKIIHQLTQLLSQPVPAREVKAVLLEAGYTRYSIRTALHAAPIKTVKKGADWYYHLPTPSCGVSTAPQLDNSTT